MDPRNSDFYRWMLNHARFMGWDIDEIDQADGEAVSRGDVFSVWAAIALADGLTADQTDQLARGLGVSPDEVTAAYLPEMRQEAMDEILSNSDLAALNNIGPENS